MTLDATIPTDEALVSTYAEIERETRAAVNTALANSTLVTKSAVTINGSTTLVSGTDVTAVGIEVVFITATGAETLNNITNAMDGDIKILWLVSGSCTFADDDTKFSNNGDADLVGATGDVIAYVNKGGDGAGTDGYWHELFRTIRS